MLLRWAAMAALCCALGGGQQQPPPPECDCEPPQQTLSCDRSQCTNAFLEARFCEFQGVPASLLGFEQDPLWSARLDEFNACTGSVVSMSYNGPFGEGDEDSMAQELQNDVGVHYVTAEDALVSTPGAGIFDGYITQPAWLPAIYPGFENLSPWIARFNDAVRWPDVNPASRNSVSFNNSVRALPLDIDYVAIGWRQDVFDRWGIKGPPRSIQQLVELSEFFNGKDHNGDGEPDWGFCLSSQANYFFSIVASILQTDTTSVCKDNRCTNQPLPNGQNIFFDVDTFRPLFEDNPGFRHAVDLYDRLLRSSNCQDQLQGPTNPFSTGNGKCDRAAAFATGKCAGVLSMPGTLTRILQSLEPTNVTFPNGTSYTWVPLNTEDSYYGRRAPFPGSLKVWNRATNTLDTCTKTLCPKAVTIADGSLVNFAPYFAEGGESYSIRASAPERKKEVLFTLFAWLSTLPPELVPLSGAYRRSHLDESLFSYLPPIMARDLKEMLGFVFLDEDEGGNPVKDLFILGFEDYMLAVEEVLQGSFLLQPDYFFSFRGDNAARAAEFDRQYNGAIDRLRARWLQTTLQYGYVEQLSRWRSALNLPSRTQAELCENAEASGSPDFVASCSRYIEEDDGFDVVPIVAPLACLLFLIAFLLVRRWHVKKELEKARNKNAQEIASRAQQDFLQQFGKDGERAVDLLSRLQVTREELEIGRELGRGAFGIVYEGKLHRANGLTTPVAIKYLQSPEAVEQQLFVYEAHLNALLSGHQFILTLHAVRIDAQPVLIATELMVGGDLRSYLVNHSKSRDIAIEDMLLSLTHIADAMRFLEENRIVHRDLAARNILVGISVTDVRIADFGMSRRTMDKDYYVKATEEKVPVKWMALEAIQTRKFTHASDAWSFGVVCWEVYTYGMTPWYELSALETVISIANGMRLDQPSGCPDDMYRDVMQKCWLPDPRHRPSFEDVYCKLLEMNSAPASRQHSKYSNPANGGYTSIAKVPSRVSPQESNDSSANAVVLQVMSDHGNHFYHPQQKPPPASSTVSEV